MSRRNSYTRTTNAQRAATPARLPGARDSDVVAFWPRLFVRFSSAQRLEGFGARVLERRGALLTRPGRTRRRLLRSARSRAARAQRGGCVRAERLRLSETMDGGKVFSAARAGDVRKLFELFARGADVEATDSVR